MLRANFGPSASATQTPGATSSASASNTLDTLTIPIVFGVVGAILTLATIVVGIIQIRMRCRHHDTETGHDNGDHELDERQPAHNIAATIIRPSPSDVPERRLSRASTL